MARPRDASNLTRVRHRVYAPTSQWKALKPWERYLARVHAVALARPNSTFVLESAAVLQGLPIFGEPRQIHIFDDVWPTSHRYSDVVLHTSRDRRQTVELDGLTVSTAAETVVDLVRVLPPAYGLAVADAAVASRQLGTTGIGALMKLGRRQVNPRGRRKLQWTWEHVDDRAESVGESVSRAIVGWLGFPAPTLQQEFRIAGFTDRTDMFWPEYGIVGESDGYGKYYASDPEAMKRKFVEEKTREDRLRTVVKGFARWDWADAMQVSSLRDKLIAAGLPVIAPSEPMMLATLRANRRSFGPSRRDDGGIRR